MAWPEANASKLGRSGRQCNLSYGISASGELGLHPLPAAAGKGNVPSLQLALIPFHTTAVLAPIRRAHAAPGVAHLLVVRDRIIDLDLEPENLR
jgi:hypothetical protein